MGEENFYVTGTGQAFIQSILVIDEPESARKIKGVLTNAGYQVDVAHDGGQAQATYKLRGPDFVIVQLILPGETGFEICERIKRVDKAVPILVLTEIDLDSSRNLAARVGADGYLTKPYDDEFLLELIRDVGQAAWERARGQQEEEVGSIRFFCKCGKRIVMPLKDKGKAWRCPKCFSRVDVPEWVGNQKAKFFTPHGSAADIEVETLDEPLKFVTIKCHHCGTFYRLTPDRLDDAKTCPKCQKQQEGALSIIGAPLSRAALASSRRVLIFRSGEHLGKKLLLPEKEVVIGRHKKCHIRHESTKLSRRHCAIRPSPDGPMVQDLGSRTGTLINEKKIDQETLLRPGDMLRAGPLILQLAGVDRSGEGDSDSELLWPSEGETPTEFVRAEVKRERFESTAEEAAVVIQQHWESVRGRKTHREETDSD